MIKKVIMPKLGEVMEKGEIVLWLKKEGDKVVEGEPLVEIATDKANMEVESIASGRLRKIVVREGETVPVMETIAFIADSMEEEIPEFKKRKESQSEIEERKVLKASPLARKIARERGVDLSQLKVGGPRKRITKQDVLRAEKELIQKKKYGKKEVLQTEVPHKGKEFVTSRLEKTMAERMQQSKREIPHFYLNVDVNCGEIVEMRQALLEEFEEEKRPHLSLTDFFVKSCAQALAKFPRINALYREGRIISIPDVNVGLAVAGKQGLVVPVIKKASGKDIFSIAKERTRLIQKVTDGKLSLQELEGATFTLSNLGMMEIKSFFAIIDPPQVCLLATGEVKEKPIVIKGGIHIAPIMEMSLSCDHRAVDGYLGSQFLQEIKKSLEDPALLLV